MTTGGLLVGVHQTTDDDCLPAAIATVLGVPVDQVPRIRFDLDLWVDPYLEALRATLGYDMLSFVLGVPPAGEWIAVVASLNQDGPHAIVMRGDRVVWDPSRRRRYPLGPFALELVRFAFVLVPLNYRRPRRWAAAGE